MSINNAQFEPIQKKTLQVMGWEWTRKYLMSLFKAGYIGDIEWKQWFRWALDNMKINRPSVVSSC